MERPWLSVIVPMYNAEDTIEQLLESIVNQNDSSIEVVICDDYSNDNSLDICHKFDDKLNIIYCQTEIRGIHCPGNTRHDAFNHSSGEWVTFADNDDWFELDAFEKIKKQIETQEKDNVKKTLISTEFRTFYENGNTKIYNMDAADTAVMHGKFYYRDFIIESGIEFPLNRDKYEDVIFNRLMFAYMASNDLKYSYVPEVTYNWRIHSKSLSHIAEKSDIDYNVYNFDSYAFAITYPFLEMYAKYRKNVDWIVQQLSYGILFMYFLVMTVESDQTKTINNLKLKIKEVLKNVNRVIDVFPQEIIMIATRDTIEYNKTRQMVVDTSIKLPLERCSFEQFIYECWEM